MKVLIVGAGSVGASIAKELKANGHTVTIIDSKPEMKNVPTCRGCVGILVTPVSYLFYARFIRIPLM